LTNRLQIVRNVLFEWYIGMARINVPNSFFPSATRSSMALKRQIKSAAHDIGLVTTFKKRAAYIGWLGYDNLGDEALLVSCERILGNNIFLYSKQYIGKLAQFFFKGQFDAVILGGGTLIPGGAYLNRYRREGYRKKIIFGTGVEDPAFCGFNKKKRLNIEAWVAEINKSHYISVRGPRSKEILESWGVNKPINIIGDPALIMRRKKLFRKKKEKTLGINIGFTDGDLWGQSDDAFFHALITQLKVLGKNGWSFKFFPVYEKDVRYIFKAMEALGQYHVSLADNYLNLESFLVQVENVDIFVGEKLHSVILAMCTYTPSVMLEYRPKCLDFMKSMDAEDFNIRTDRIRDGNVVDKINSLYENLEFAQNKLFEIIRKTSDRLEAAAVKINAIISED